MWKETDAHRANRPGDNMAISHADTHRANRPGDNMAISHADAHRANRPGDNMAISHADAWYRAWVWGNRVSNSTAGQSMVKFQKKTTCGEELIQHTAVILKPWSLVLDRDRESLTTSNNSKSW